MPNAAVCVVGKDLNQIIIKNALRELFSRICAFLSVCE